jgi:hypothetical protein
MTRCSRRSDRVSLVEKWPSARVFKSREEECAALSSLDLKYSRRRLRRLFDFEDRAACRLTRFKRSMSFGDIFQRKALADVYLHVAGQNFI